MQRTLIIHRDVPSLKPERGFHDIVGPSLIHVLVFIFLLASLSPASECSTTGAQYTTPPSGIKVVWVFFADKGNLRPDDLDSYQYESQLPVKTRLRRRKAQGRVIDASDLPVFRPYIDEVLELGAELRATSRWLNAISVEVPDNALPKISKLSFVKAVEPLVTYRRSRFRIQHAPEAQRSISDTEHAVNKQAACSTYGMSAAQIQQIHADVLHNMGYTGEEITIALLDTGFDLSHEALRNVHVLAEYDFVNGDRYTSDNPPEDDIGQDDHGTEVLSVIAGNSPGNIIGVAYAADYLLAKTERVSLNGTLFEQEIEEDWWVAGLEWAELHGADIVSSSLGYSDWYSYSDMDGKTARTTVAANVAIDKGMVIVVSAGNEGKSSDWPHISAPADGFYVIAVGAVDYRGEIADFSSIGPTYDGRIKPDLVAMGDGTYVADPNSTNSYRMADGTSMATPLVAGVVALLMQSIPDLEDPKDVIKLLKYTSSRTLLPDNYYGWGIVNAEAAFQYGTSPRLKELKNWDPNGVMPASEQVIAYPNPVKRSSLKGGLNIYSPESIESINIYSISGSLIYEIHDMDGARFSMWDLKNMHGHNVASGIYICVIRSSSGNVFTEKIAVID